VRKRFYISPKSPSVYQVELIIQKWLENHRYEMLNLTMLTEALNIELSSVFIWGRLEIDMQMMDENGFVIEVTFLNTSTKKYENVLTKIEW